uniref:Cytochrome b n=1 Tax=Sigalphus bicolor TaxID=515846 RepID=A0A0A6ZKY7_9HYME|nr:cytochrome b [Sigalphus bicolor]
MKKNLLFLMFKKSILILPTPVNITFLWNYGSLLGVTLFMQILTGIILSMHYSCNVDYSFFSLIHIIQDINYGWFIRLMHMNGASLLFLLIYIHIGRGLYYSSYKLLNVWMSGVILLLFMMMISFVGYVLPWGQMSFWGATVITNMLSALPYIGGVTVEWLWGGFSVNNATLTRFYSFHFMLPFILLMIVIIHLMFLHETGSSNPLGLNSNYYKIYFHNYFTLKDLFGFLIIIMMFFMIIIFYPYLFSDPENFIKANSMITPIHIQPEWYFLFAYSILRSIPNKLSGVLALIFSILILMILPFLKNFKFQSNYFYMFNQFYFWLFMFNFLMLTWLGSQVIEYPFIQMAQIFTIIYFSYFILNFYLKIFIDQMNF